MKSVWQGEITFGVIALSVELYPAMQSRSLGFKLLHARCNTPLSYQRWCAYCQEIVPWENVVKSMQLKGGLFFVLTPENLKKLRSLRTETIDIVEFIDKDMLEPIYYHGHYYIVPTEEGKQGYTLFTVALAKLGKIAIGRFTLKDKEYVCAIQNYKKGLLLSTLNYACEITAVKKFESITLPTKIADQDEFALLEEAMIGLSSSQFSIDQFKDRFAQRLQKEIKKGLKGTIFPKAKAQLTPE
jgi:DNA end-binding protein Ku